MKQLLSSFVVVLFVATSCSRTPDDVWRDTKSAGRHMQRGVNTMGGKHGESRQIRNGDEFDGEDKSHANDFIGMEDDQAQGFVISDQIPQSRESPGELGSQIPGIESFKDPLQSQATADIFQVVHFDYNSSLVKSDQDIATLQKIAGYLKSRPNIYVFVEGHCDKRGPSAYNFALGANRSNAVRNLLVRDGVEADRIFTVSYGKDQLLVEGDTEEAHQQNRRACFKIYER